MMKSAVFVGYCLGWMSSSTVSGFAPKQASSAFSNNRQCFHPQEKVKTVALFATSPSTEEKEAAVINNSTAVTNADDVEEEELSETQRLMKQVKEAGVAGGISYAGWELLFWTVSVPVCVLGYREATGHWPDLSDSDDKAKLGAEAFAFVNFARFAVPLRIGLALGTTPWVQTNIVDRFLTKEQVEENNNEVMAKEDDDVKAAANTNGDNDVTTVLLSSETIEASPDLEEKKEEEKPSRIDKLIKFFSRRSQ